MKFTYNQYPNEPRYFVWLKNRNYDIVVDSDIAKYIGITIEEYQKELCSLGAHVEKDFCFEELYFNKKMQVQNAVKVLNEKYEVLFPMIH